MTYSSASASKMFAATSTGIYDVTTPGAVGAVARVLTQAYGAFVNFATSAGQYLYYVNGVDSACYYDGAAWNTSGITGPALTSLVSVETYRQRLFFLQTNFLGFYYLAADSIAGAATAFRIGSLCRFGGKVISHVRCPWTGAQAPTTTMSS